MKKKYTALFLLLLTTFFWGVTFAIVKDAIATVDVFVFLAQRFTLAFLLLLLICLTGRRHVTGKTIFSGMILGFFLFSAYAFQTVALLYTTASNTGFLTGLNVLFVPLIGALFMRERVSLNVTGGVLLAFIGLFLLCTNGSLSLNKGDMLAATCAVCVALHLLLTGAYSRRPGVDVYVLTTVQIGTVALLSFAATLFGSQSAFAYYPQITGALLICAVFATVFAFLVQTAMQRVLSPTHTALIFCMEPVFGAVYAYFALGERMGLAGLSGAVLILAGMLLSEFGPVQREEEETVHLVA